MIRRNAAAIVRNRLRQTAGYNAVIDRGHGFGNPITVALGQAENNSIVQSSFAIEHDRHDVFIKASDYGAEPMVGDRIVVTLDDGSALNLGVYVPETSKQCFSNSDFEGTELRVFCKAIG